MHAMQCHSISIRMLSSDSQKHGPKCSMNNRRLRKMSMLTDSSKQADKAAQRRCFNQVTGVHTRNQTLRPCWPPFFNTSMLLTSFIICPGNKEVLQAVLYLLPHYALSRFNSAIMDLGPEWQKAQRGELYRAFVPELIAARNRCIRATDAFNQAKDTSRRNMVTLWRE